MTLAETILQKNNDRGLDSMPILIAEAGVNHGGNLETAKQLIAEAKEGGADAIKFQTYRADTLASRYSPAYWDIEHEPTTSQHQLFQKYDKFWKSEFESLKQYSDDCDIEFLSTPFDLESAEFLNDLMGVFKVSSSDITNKPFIEFLCGYGKPLILSTGASNLDEIDAAISWIDSTETPVALLHCVLNYPTLEVDANLRMIRGLKNRYPDRIVGYSDHTLPVDMKTLEAAWLLGATILEKHFTHDKALPGNDHYHSMDKNDLFVFRENILRLTALLGSEDKQSLPGEASAREHARRSLVAACDIPSDQKITAEMITWKRPAHGISPSDLDQVLGLVTSQDISMDDLLVWNMFQKD